MKALSKLEKIRRREEVSNKAAAGQLRLPGAIREIRQSLGLTQAEFAKRFGLTRIQVIELESGKSNPTKETLEKVGKPFGFALGFVQRERTEQEILSDS